MTVAQLLADARAAHARYQQEQRRPNADYRLCEQHVAEAQRCRVEAEALDPAYHDAAWRQDRVPHAELMAFYAKYEEIP